MKKILGLDLGVSSIGWALIEEHADDHSILGLGSRIIPLTTDDKDEFSKGNAISKNQKRTLKRTMRKSLDRYQLRRTYLVDELKRLQMLPGADLFLLSSTDLYKLRVKGLSEKLEPGEIGRIFLHLNQRRGYKSARSDVNLDKKDTEYVAEVKNRYQQIKDQGLTIGQYFFSELIMDPLFRVKEKVFPREAYIEEFNLISKKQQQYYPEILSDQKIARIRDEIIYYQRPLKSQKGLVSICEFEGINRLNREGKKVFAGPRVAPRSSPLFQVCKIWETINNITLHNHQGDEFPITLEQKQQLFDYLDNNEKLTFNELIKILGLKRNSGWTGNEQLSKGLQGNTTKVRLKKCFGNISDHNAWLRFDLSTRPTGNDTFLVDKKTGQISNQMTAKVITPAFENEPLYQLWHLLYSVDDQEDLIATLVRKFSFTQEIAEQLSKIDFTQAGFGNKSARAIRKILPLLMDGFVYSQACELAGYNHSDSLTKEENLERQLLDKLPLLRKNSLRQPVVEKILNQMINLVNAVVDRYGKPDEIRIELARELKQSKDERNETSKTIAQRERENNIIAERLTQEYGLKATRRNISKWRLFHEITHYESKVNAVCIYCGQPFGITQALKGEEVDIEHIIPVSRLFDDSLNNKTLSHRKCNTEKGNKTAFDYMKTKSEEEFQAYLQRVNETGNRSKRMKLLMSADKIPDDFIDRQLRQTQYISKKSREILRQLCRDVWATSGSVTEYLRRIWGWNDVLMNLHLKQIKENALEDLLEYIEIEDDAGNKSTKETIRGWSKRDDHRHHAIDALIIASTKQGIIQRINGLNAEFSKFEKTVETDPAGYGEKRTSLENFLKQLRPFRPDEVEQAAANILVSYKPGKKVATIGRRIEKKHGKMHTAQTGIIVPRGPLSEESVYGKILTHNKEVPLKKLFEVPELIVKPRIKRMILERLQKNENDPKKAYSSCKKDPLFLDAEHNQELRYASIYKAEYVIKYPVAGLTKKDVPSIVDPVVREIVRKRLEEFNNNPKEAFKNLDENPLYYNSCKRISIRSVRCFTGLSAVEPIKKDDEGNGIGFVKPGNNHHIAIYTDENGQYHEHIVSFWHAIERKKFKIPVIIASPISIWEMITETKQTLPESFLEKLPDVNWRLVLSLQQNELFLLNSPADELIGEAKSMISQKLFRVQSVSESDYFFRVHYETKNDKTSDAKALGKFLRIKSLKALFAFNPKKVRMNILGELTF